jgi:hypothetical protein
LSFFFFSSSLFSVSLSVSLSLSLPSPTWASPFVFISFLRQGLPDFPWAGFVLLIFLPLPPEYPGLQVWGHHAQCSLSYWCVLLNSGS